MAEPFKVKIGRPSKYDAHTPEEWIAIIEAYIEECVDDTKKVLDAQLNQREEIQMVKIPTIEGLCLRLNIHKDTLYEWAKDDSKTEFSDALGIIKHLQGDRLLSCGLAGKYNTTIVKLMLMTNHGYAEQSNSKVEQVQSLADVIQSSEGGGETKE